jgi:predicted DCC family thiol-disulfide oxidoreductase YuxK
MTPESSQTTIVFFDGGCPLCSREINHYRHLPARSEILWIDVTREAARLTAYGLNAEDAMRAFHVLDRGGRMVTGARAFLTLWRELPYYRFLSRSFEALGLVPVLEWGYEKFARWHYRRRCGEGVCR